MLPRSIFQKRKEKFPFDLSNMDPQAKNPSLTSQPGSG